MNIGNIKVFLSKEERAELGQKDSIHAPVIFSQYLNSDDAPREEDVKMSHKYPPLKAGDKVVFSSYFCYFIKSNNDEVWDAIIDPFISGEVNTRDCVLLFLNPKKVGTKLRHVYETPGIFNASNANAEEEDDEEWLNDGCRGCY